MSDIPAFPYELLWGERSVRVGGEPDPGGRREFLALAPRVPVRTHVTRTPLDRAGDALDDLRAGRVTAPRSSSPEARLRDREGHTQERHGPPVGGTTWVVPPSDSARVRSASRTAGSGCSMAMPICSAPSASSIDARRRPPSVEPTRTPRAGRRPSRRARAGLAARSDIERHVGPRSCAARASASTAARSPSWSSTPAELPRDLADLREHLRDLVVQLLEMRRAPVWRLPLEHADAEQYRGKHLREILVELAGEAALLVLLGLSSRPAPDRLSSSSPHLAQRTSSAARSRSRPSRRRFSAVSADCRARSSSAARSSEESGESWKTSIRPSSTPCASIGAAERIHGPFAARERDALDGHLGRVHPGIESASDTTSWPRRSGEFTALSRSPERSRRSSRRCVARIRSLKWPDMRRRKEHEASDRHADGSISGCPSTADQEHDREGERTDGDAAPLTELERHEHDRHDGEEPEPEGRVIREDHGSEQVTKRTAALPSNNGRRSGQRRTRRPSGAVRGGPTDLPRLSGVGRATSAIVRGPQRRTTVRLGARARAPGRRLDAGGRREPARRFAKHLGRALEQLGLRLHQHRRLLERLGRVLHRLGLPAHRSPALLQELEDGVQRLQGPAEDVPLEVTFRLEQYEWSKGYQQNNQLLHGRYRALRR